MVRWCYWMFLKLNILSQATSFSNLVSLGRPCSCEARLRLLTRPWTCSASTPYYDNKIYTQTYWLNLSQTVPCINYSAIIRVLSSGRFIYQSFALPFIVIRWTQRGLTAHEAKLICEGWRESGEPRKGHCESVQNKSPVPCSCKVEVLANTARETKEYFNGLNVARREQMSDKVYQTNLQQLWKVLVLPTDEM